MEGKGLSVSVHIWEPLAHSCRLSTCLRMDLDGTGRERLGGRFAPADGNPDGSWRQLQPSRQERVWGNAARAAESVFPCGLQGKASHRPGLSCLCFLPRRGD